MVKGGSCLKTILDHDTSGELSNWGAEPIEENREMRKPNYNSHEAPWWDIRIKTFQFSVV